MPSSIKICLVLVNLPVVGVDNRLSVTEEKGLMAY